MEKISSILKNEVLIFDGAMGTEIYNRHVFINVCFDELCLTSPNLIKEIHKDYLSAGADVITTNTFGANSIKLRQYAISEKMEEINISAVKIVKEAIEELSLNRNILVAGSVGPLGGALLNKEKVVLSIKAQLKALVKGGVDFIVFETFSSRQEIEYCFEALKGIDIPFIFSVTVNEKGESNKGESLQSLMSPLTSHKTTKQIGWGINCSVGPESMLATVEEAIKFLNLPLIVKPNAGIPRNLGDRQIYMCSPEYITSYAIKYLKLGVRGIGGCCGTTPKHIKEIANAVKPVSKTHFEIKEKIFTTQVDTVESVKLAERSKLGKKLSDGSWITSIEITPPRGYDYSDIIKKATICKQNNIDAINIPDGPRASSRMSSIITAIKIIEHVGIEPILHFCCRDRNLIGMQSDILGCAAANINNILFITGDPPKHGDYPFATGVFDADSIAIVKIQNNLNHGLDLGTKKINPPTASVIGVGVDPNAIDIKQEIKRFREKIDAGAQFAISQPVFDPDALLRFIDEIGEQMIPLIAGIWPLVSYRNAAFMKHEVPGVFLPDSIMQRMERFDQKDDQKKEGILIARESLDHVRSSIQGVQVSAPFGNVHSALQVIV